MVSKTTPFLQETIGLQPFDAIQLQHYTRIHFFLKNGINPDLRDGEERTLLMSACNLAEEKVAVKFSNLLLKYRARIESKDGHGLCALHYAVLNEHKNLVVRLLEFAGDFNINMQDIFGNTALMLAVFTRNYDIVRSIVDRLRKYHLSVDIRNNEGATPLTLATLMHENEIAGCLIEFGKASTQIREKPWGQSSKDCKHKTAMYINVLSGSSIYTTIAEHLIARNSTAYQDGPKECRNVTKPVNYPTRYTHITRDSCLPTLPSTEKPSVSRKYQYKDLKPVYHLYEQELSTSYQKNAPLLVKIHSCANSHLSEKQNSWDKTIQSLKQRRHTIALSHSLPNNISTKNLFGSVLLTRHARSYSLGTNEAFEASTLRQNTRRNSFGLTYTNSVPATAPGGLQTNHSCASVPGDSSPPKRRSVSFQSPYNIASRDFEGNFPFDGENSIFSGAPTIPEE